MFLRLPFFGGVSFVLLVFFSPSACQCCMKREGGKWLTLLLLLCTTLTILVIVDLAHLLVTGPLTKAEGTEEKGAGLPPPTTHATFPSHPSNEKPKRKHKHKPSIDSPWARRPGARAAAAATAAAVAVAVVAAA